MSLSGDNEDGSLNCKLVIVGDGMVGKTALLNAFANDSFVDNYVPTIFETSAKDVELQKPINRVVTMGLWDTGGQEEFDKVRILAYPGAQVILMCYSVDTRYSLENILGTWHPELTLHCPKVPVFLVGCKSDLRGPAAEELVTEEEVAEVCEKIGARGRLECSAKTRDNVVQVFERAAKIYVEDRLQKKNKKRGSGLFSCISGRRKKKN